MLNTVRRKHREMPSNFNLGGKHACVRRGLLPWFMSVSLSCGVLVLLLIVCVRELLPLYTISPSLSITVWPGSDVSLSRYNRVNDSYTVQPLRLPEYGKLIYRENETLVVEGTSILGEVTKGKQVIHILYRNVVDSGHAGAYLESKSTLSKEGTSGPGRGGKDVSGERGSGLHPAGLGVPLNPQSKKKPVRTSQALEEDDKSKVSVSELLNWRGELDGVDLRQHLQKLTSHGRRQWLKLNWENFKILQVDTVSKRFSRRLKDFFNGPDYSVRQESEGARTDSGLLLEQRTEESLLLLDSEPVDDSSGHVRDSGKPQGLSGEGNDGSYTHSSGTTDKSGDCKLRFFLTWISPLSSFGPREHICLESVFTIHPTACVVIVSRSFDSSEGRKMLQPFVDRGLRIIAVSPDLPFLFRGTPAADWFKALKSGNQDPGEISLSQNLSNILRMAALYKYGGIYVDNDILLLRDLSGLRNVIGAQSVYASTGEWARLNNAVMIFDKKSPVLYKYIEEFSLTFNGNKWGHNGPYLATRVTRRLVGREGYNFSIASPSAFYPVNWARIEKFFKSASTQEEIAWQLAKLEQLEGASYAIHLWNKQSRDMDVQKGSLIDVLFRKVCIFCDLSSRTASI